MADSAKRENLWLNLGLNVVLPALILSKGQGALERIFGLEAGAVNPLAIFLIALAFPFFYGVLDLAKRKKWNIFSIFGVLNVLLTGTVGLFELSREWIIAKEAGIPAILGFCVLLSAFTSKPLARVLIYNDALLDVKMLDQVLDKKNATLEFAKSLRVSTFLIAASFFVSALIQFFLASSIFTGKTSGAEFNAQVGKMTWVSYIAVLGPCMIISIAALLKIFKDLKRLTGLSLEDSLAEQLRQKPGEQ